MSPPAMLLGVVLFFSFSCSSLSSMMTPPAPAWRRSSSTLLPSLESRTTTPSPAPEEPEGREGNRSPSFSRSDWGDEETTKTSLSAGSRNPPGPSPFSTNCLNPDNHLSRSPGRPLRQIAVDGGRAESRDDLPRGRGSSSTPPVVVASTPPVVVVLTAAAAEEDASKKAAAVTRAGQQRQRRSCNTRRGKQVLTKEGHAQKRLRPASAAGITGGRVQLDIAPNWCWSGRVLTMMNWG